MYSVMEMLAFPREEVHGRHGPCLLDIAILGVRVMLVRIQTKVTGKEGVGKANKARLHEPQ